jgi:hypothetical protein
VEIRTALIHVHDEAGNVIETHEHAGDFKRALSVIALNKKPPHGKA